MKINNVVSSSIAVVAVLAASVCVSQAQISSLQLRVPFTDTNGGTTAASDYSTTGSNVLVTVYDNTFTANDFQGAPGTGVSGLGVALDFSSPSYFVNGAGEGSAPGFAPVAYQVSSALNFGVLSNYTATIWFNANAQMANGNTTGPRIFVLGANGITDKLLANSISIYWQQWNEVSATVGTTEIDAPTYATFVPTNQWLFYALTVQNGTNAILYRGTDQTNISAVKTNVLTLANGTISLTNSAGSVLMVGNIVNSGATDEQRGFDGWINDLRFYAGDGTSNNVEDIRWSAVAVTGLSAVSGLNQANLTWNALGGSGSYNVLRSTTSGSETFLANVTTNYYADTTAANGTTYYYVITAVDNKGDQNATANSAEASVFMSTPPPVPTGFSATSGNTQVTLNWTASAGATSYIVTRSSNSGGRGSGGETIFATGVTGTSYVDSAVTNGVTYYYTIAAVNSQGSVSTYSTEASAIPVGAPLAPIGLTPTETGHFNVLLHWTDPNPTNIVPTDTYTIQSSPNGSSWTTIATGVTTNHYTDTTTVSLQTVYYQVLAVNGGGTSVASSPTNITLVVQVTLLDIAEQSVRAAFWANTNLDDNNQGTPPSVGYLKVKYVNDATPSDSTSCVKTYFRWNFGPTSPNTNADLSMTWSLVANSANTEMNLWSLNQPYPFTTGLTGSINANGTTSTNGGVTWNNAQANDTNYNASLQGTFQMLTNGTYTASPIVFLSVPYLNTFPGAVTIKIPAPWGNLLHNGELVFCLCGTTINQSSAGYRIANNVTSLIYNQIAGTNLPTMSAIPNTSVIISTSATNSFTITDPDGTVGNLTATAVVSGDTTGGATATITGGPGANENVVVTGGGTVGTATVEVTVTDENGDSAQRTFTLTTLPPIQPPTISAPPATNTLASTPLVVPFTIADVSEALNTLTVSASVGNGAVLVSAVTNGSGANWTVTVTPVANTNGIGVVTLSVSDTNGNTTTTSITVLVRSSSQTVFSDFFNYANGSLFTVDNGVWTQIGPSGGVINITGGLLDIAVNLNAETAYANLLGAPYAPGAHGLIYVTFTANWSSDIATPSWLYLAPFGGVSVAHIAAVGNVPASGGGFYATIANNGADAVSTNLQTLNLNTTYNVAVRYNVDKAQATLWIDATNEADTNGTPVTANDVLTPGSISSIILSQTGGAAGANVALGGLTVSAVTLPQVSTVSLVGTNVQVTFTAGAGDVTNYFGLTSTTNLSVPFNAVSPTITPLGGGVFRATLPASGNASFYQLYRQPYSFSY